MNLISIVVRQSHSNTANSASDFNKRQTAFQSRVFFQQSNYIVSE